MSTPQIDLLIVNDPGADRRLLEQVLVDEPRIRVAGAVDSGGKALDFLARHRADVALIDIHAPGMEGLEVTRRIMESRPIPIIVMCVDMSDPRSAATVFQAHEAGAVAVVEKPVTLEHPDCARLAHELRDTVRLMSEVAVIRRWPRERTGVAPPALAPAALCRSGMQVVAIGASTGGPPALQTLLGSLPTDFPAPVLVVQHITAGFLPGLAEWLGQTTPLRVQIAAHGLQALPGHVYLAPDGLHLGLDAEGCIHLSRGQAENGLRPAIDWLFRSVSQRFGRKAIGVLLTGMGKDGARELTVLREHGGATIVQDKATSVVHGMPGAAIALGAAGQVLPIEQIADALCRIVTPASKNGVARE